MITRQLQENWRSSKTRFIPEKLIFEVTDAGVVHETKKYVVSTPTPAGNHSSPVSRTIFQSVFSVTKIWERDTLDCSHQRKGKDL